MYHPPIWPERQVWRWYRSCHPLTQIVLGFLSVTLVLFLCSFCASGWPAFVSGLQSGLPNSRVGSQPTAITQAPDQPRMGGPLSDFIGQFGPPSTDSDGDKTFNDEGDTVTITVGVSGPTVNSIAISGPSSWDVSATTQYCEQFLPDGAVETGNFVGHDTDIDYSSPMGDITMQLSQTNCDLFVTPS